MIKLEQQDLNKRMIVAIALSVGVLMLFSYLFPPQKNIQQQNLNATKVANNKVVTIKNESSSNSTNQSINEAPNLNKKNPTVGKKSFDTISVVETKRYTLKVDKFGRVFSVILKNKKYKDNENRAIELIAQDKILPWTISFSKEELNNKLLKVPYEASSNKIDATSKEATLKLTQKVDDLVITKIIKFYPDGHYDFNVKLNKKIEFFVTNGHRPLVDKSKYLVNRGVLLRDKNGVITIIEDNELKENQKFDNITILSSFDRYYATIFYNFNNPFSVAVVNDIDNSPVGFVGKNGELSLHGYMGAKEWKALEALDKRLTDAIEFGWFTFLAKPFFKIMLAIYDYIGNWGWTIVIFTILVKIVLFPLSYKGLMSMQKLKDLAPKMQAIREKYKDDPMKMNQQMMELYKKHGANPMGGCLPMLLQIPIFFALYRVLLNADELQGAPWILWIHDLSRMDPYFILPILMGATMYIQQVITPTNITDPMQQKIFKWFPVIMTVLFATFPSGLVLYWLVNNILSIAQQYYINKAYEKYKAKMKLSKGK